MLGAEELQCPGQHDMGKPAQPQLASHTSPASGAAA